MTPATLIKEARQRHDLSQRRLALRAGTSQSAIARIESGEEDVTWNRLRAILLSMGEEPALATRPAMSRYDAADLLAQRRLSASERLESGLAFDKLLGELSAAAGRA